MTKRLFDFICSFIGLVFLLPIFVLIGLGIKWDSIGPVFYRGARTGRYGKPFRIFKFRTMVVNGEKLGGLSTAKNDFRVTRVGRFLRKHKLDELPQLINVLKGDMSLTGPRPEVPEYTSLYSEEEKIILSVRPGIADYASLHFFNLSEELGSKDADKVYLQKVRPVKNRLRVQYVKERTFCGDARIIVQALSKIVRGIGGVRQAR